MYVGVWAYVGGWACVCVRERERGGGGREMVREREREKLFTRQSVEDSL